MSLGRKLSFEAGATVGPDHGGVARSRRKDETVAWPHLHAFAACEDEIDRTTCAIQKLRVSVFVFAVCVARPVRPAVDVTGFAA
jgi:hypothetical protein